MASSYNSPCAACKFLRRKCMAGCIFAPYFPPEEPQKFANVHKIFGASNVTKLLNELLPHQREDAVNSLAYEAEARVRDPVYGCVGAISFLQRQVHRLQKELDAANADLIRLACNDVIPGASSSHHHHVVRPPQIDNQYGIMITRNNNNNNEGFYNDAAHQGGFPLLPWSSHDMNQGGGGSGGEGNM